MKLIYRGIRYNHKPVHRVDPVDHNTEPAAPPIAAPATARYRGVTYSPNQASQGIPVNCQLRFLGGTYCKTLFY